MAVSKLAAHPQSDLMGSPSKKDSSHDEHARAYWVNSLLVVAFILSLWFVLSLGCGVLFREWLDHTLPNVGGAPFGFWMAQQGSIIGFLVLLVLYMVLMNALDGKNGYGRGDRE